MKTAMDRLAGVNDELKAILSDPLLAINDSELCGLTAKIEETGRLLDRARVAAAAEIQERSRFELHADGLAARNGFTKGTRLLEWITGVSSAEAARRVEVGAAVRPRTGFVGDVLPPLYPHLAEALNHGDIGVEAARSIIRCLKQARRAATDEELDIAEEQLTVHALSEPADCVADLARALRDRLDPDGTLPREDDIRAHRGITLGRENHGVTPISGGLDPETSALLRAAFSEANAPSAQPRFLSDVDRRDGTETVVTEHGDEIIKIRDVRTVEQRQHDVLGGMIKAGVRATGNGPGEIRSTADVTAVVLLKDLERGAGPAWIEGVTETVSVELVQQLMCDAAFRKVVLGNDGEVLALGRTSYPFNTAQHRAIRVRDGGCTWDCDAPPGWCDIHHVQEFNANGAEGKTDVGNGVMLCPAHHRLLHQSGWSMRMVNGKPQVLAPFQIDPTQTWRPVGHNSLSRYLGFGA